MIDKTINFDRNSKRCHLLSNLKPGDKSFWKISRSLRGVSKNQIPFINYGNTKLTSDTDKAEALANTFAQSNNLTSHYKHSIDKHITKTISDFKNSNPSLHTAEFTSICEVQNILSSLKPSKSPGFDNVSNVLLKKLPFKALKLLVMIFNSCIKLNYFPNKFKNAKVVAICKPNKSKNDPNSYRPISLLNNVGKIFEKIIHSRLNDFVNSNGILAEEQFGFKKEHSTTHQINRIKNIILHNKKNKKSTGIIVLDVEKAFDTVWHNGLIYKLLRANIPTYLCKLIADFISNRKFSVVINNETSPAKSVTAGLPQGSVLSPLLYSIYTSDFKALKYIKTAYYADDTALISSSKLTSALIKKM